MDAVVHHPVTRADHRFGTRLVELDHRLGDWTRRADTFPEQHEDWRGPPLETNLGHHPGGLGEVRQDTRLVHRKTERLLYRQRQALLEAPDPDVVHQVGLPDHKDPVRLHLRHHAPVVRVTSRNPIPVSRGRQCGIVNVGNRDDVDVRE